MVIDEPRLPGVPTLGDCRAVPEGCRKEERHAQAAVDLMASYLARHDYLREERSRCETPGLEPNPHRAATRIQAAALSFSPRRYRYAAWPHDAHRVATRGAT